jgi:hypothetical protein
VYYTVATPAPAPTYSGPISLCVNYSNVLFDVAKEQRAQLLAGTNPATTSLNTTSKQICGQVSSDSPSVQLAVVQPVNHAPTLSTGLAPSASQTNIKGVLVPNLVQISSDFNFTPDPDNSAPFNSCYAGAQLTTCSDSVYHLWIGQVVPLVSKIAPCPAVTANYVVVIPGSGNPCSNYAVSADPLNGIQATVPTGKSSLYFYAIDQVGLSVVQNYVASHPGNLPADGTAATIMCTWANLDMSQCGISLVNQVPATAISYSLGQTATEETVYAGQSASFQVLTNQSYTIKSPYYSYVTCAVNPSSGTGIGCVASPAVLSQAGARSVVLITTTGTSVGTIGALGRGTRIFRGVVTFGAMGILALVMIPRRFRHHVKVIGLMCLAMLCCGTMLSCGGGASMGSGGSSTVGATPAGDYTITATATLMQAVGPDGTPSPATDPVVSYVPPQSITFILHVR